MSEQELTNVEMRRIDSARYPQLFDELITLANELLLKGEFQKEPFNPPTSIEADVIRSIGTRGLSTALDISANAKGFNPFSDSYSDTEERSSDDIWADSPFREHEFYSAPIDFEIIDTVRQFGKALMKDAYKTLGPDVEEKIRQLKKAETLEEYARVFGWLIVRFEDIADDRPGLIGDEADEYGNYTYSPVRLSRYFTGSYPNVTIAPTCLGVSIITASFLEKAGLPHLHAGVMETYQEQAGNQISKALVSSTMLLMENFDNSDHLIPTLIDKILEERKRIDKDRGYHVANYVKTKSGTWWQIDANFQETLPIYHDTSNERLDDAYSDINDLKDIAPGIERSVYFGLYVPHTQMGDWLDNIKWEKLPSDEITSALLQDESTPQKICDIVVSKFTGDYRQYFPQETVKNVDRMEKEKVLSNTFYSLFTKYVLWNEDIADVRERCIKDPEYLNRRVEDVQAIQYLMIPAAMIELAGLQKMNEQGLTHESIELGDPATRIGFAALSDVAVYFDDRLPPSFWISNWPSKVPITETILSDDADRIEQRALLHNCLTHIALMPSPLKYRKSYGIIEKFLPDMMPPEGGEENGEG